MELKVEYTKILVLVMGIFLILSVFGYLDLKKENKKLTEANLQIQTSQNSPQPMAAEIKVQEPEPLVDTIPPKFDKYCSSFITPTLKKFEEYVCLEIGQWQGYQDFVNSVPITGKVQGDVKSITVDGKKITWDENNEIYQRINLMIYGGLNKYKVIVEDKSGNKTTGYIQTTSTTTPDSLDVNLNQ